ncbi:hypothetical protein [Acinetobacter venetianus]|uniref:Uncharacterized protein n=1 Tax=Acinetobacter venetianus TaxID=52133 RepID=A0A150HY51_9GAMM|nr:hypothetical protein [Acinetobacter venetianus]KXZ72126.1 hypothetical protein AVENLUH13518_00737 [Acinetobacter venetianus]
MTMVNIRNEIGATFKMRTFKADGTTTKETEEFHNLVLDTGLQRMGIGAWVQRCYVGTGNSTPIASQTQLDATLASTSTVQSTVTGMNTTTKPYYYSIQKTYRFGEGVAAGNLTEVGLGWTVSGQNPCWNRALIKDANGNPTTLTVLSDEFLDVTVEIRIYPAETISGSFDFKNKLGEVISTHTYNGYVHMIHTTDGTNTPFEFDSLQLYTNASITDNPTANITGTSLGANNKTTTISTIIAPTTLRGAAKFTLTQGNGECSGFVVKLQGAHAAPISNVWYKAVIDPPITKTNEMEITWTIDLTWGRYVT